jgi:acyl-CoA thioesterase
MDADALAGACADAMWAEDAASHALGIQLIAAAPGHAVLALVVTETMANWHGTCHGGYIYLLADTAFGYACNTRNQRMVAQHCSISYLNPAQRGDRLTAQAIERQRAARSGIYDVTVKREDGLVIAEFRGTGRATGGTLVPGAKA